MVDDVVARQALVEVRRAVGSKVRIDELGSPAGMRAGEEGPVPAARAEGPERPRSPRTSAPPRLRSAERWPRSASAAGAPAGRRLAEPREAGTLPEDAAPGGPACGARGRLLDERRRRGNGRSGRGLPHAPEVVNEAERRGHRLHGLRDRRVRQRLLLQALERRSHVVQREVGVGHHFAGALDVHERTHRSARSARRGPSALWGHWDRLEGIESARKCVARGAGSIQSFRHGVLSSASGTGETRREKRPTIDARGGASFGNGIHGSGAKLSHHVGQVGGVQLVRRLVFGGVHAARKERTAPSPVRTMARSSGVDHASPGARARG